MTCPRNCGAAGSRWPTARSPPMTDEPEAPEPDHDERGLDLARSIARGLAGRTGARKRRLKNTRRVDPISSSAHPDDRDPQPLDSTLGRLVSDQGWETELRVHGVFTRWASVVGDEVAAHVSPESYADGRLVVRTDSTAWATDMKLLAGNRVPRLRQDLGGGRVEVIDVLGPHAPGWSTRGLRVKGGAGGAALG